MPYSNGNVPPHERAHKVDIQERIVQVMELARAGHTLRDIAKQVGVSHTQVNKDLATALADMSLERAKAAEVYRIIQDDRYSALLAQCMPLALDTSNPKWDRAIDKVLRIMDSLNKLHGLYAPIAPDENARPPKSITINLNGDTSVSFNREQQPAPDDSSVITID